MKIERFADHVVALGVTLIVLILAVLFILLANHFPRASVAGVVGIVLATCYIKTLLWLRNNS